MSSEIASSTPFDPACTARRFTIERSIQYDFNVSLNHVQQRSKRAARSSETE